MLMELSKHDRICFLGDSITAHGKWIAEIVQYFMDNYPELEIGFYNCGIAGSRGGEANLKNRLYADCLDLFPRYLVVMFGMNDALTYLHSPSCKEENKEERIKASLDRYKNGLSEVIHECIKLDITPIMCMPTPYDEYNDAPRENFFADAGLVACGEIVKSLAEEYNLPVIDMHSLLLNYIDKKPINEDRTHLSDFGNHLIAEHFLVETGYKDIIEPDKKVTLCEKNKKRFDAEQIYREIMFIERDCMLWQNTEKSPLLVDRKKLFKEKIKNENLPWQSKLEIYETYADYKDEVRGEVIKHTINLYK